MFTNSIMQQIYDIKNWKRTVAKCYEVYVCMPKQGTKVTNKFEGSSYLTDANKPLVISGTAGECWVVDFNKLASKYVLMNNAPITYEEINSRLIKVGEQAHVMDWLKIKVLPAKNMVYWTFHLPKKHTNFPVKTSWGDILLANRTGVKHDAGDFLICSDRFGSPNLDNVWVINGTIFPRTYDMRGYAGLGGVNNTVFETPRPATLIGDAKGKNNKQSDSKIMANENRDLAEMAKNEATEILKLFSMCASGVTTGNMKYTKETVKLNSHRYNLYTVNVNVSNNEKTLAMGISRNIDPMNEMKHIMSVEFTNRSTGKFINRVNISIYKDTEVTRLSTEIIELKNFMIDIINAELALWH